MSYKSLSILYQMVPNLNNEGIQLINSQFEVFVKIIDIKVKLADVTWQNVFMSFIFEEERQAIERHLQ